MSTQPDADGAQPAADPGEWLARDNEPDIGPWNTGLDGINLVGPEAEQEAQAG